MSFGLQSIKAVQHVGMRLQCDVDGADGGGGGRGRCQDGVGVMVIVMVKPLRDHNTRNRTLLNPKLDPHTLNPKPQSNPNTAETTNKQTREA